jgi:ribonuclease D
MYGTDIVSVVKKGFKVPPDRLPVYPRQKAPKLPPQVPDRIKILKDWRDGKAADLELEPPMIFTKAQLTAVAVECPRSIKAVAALPDLKNWQKKEFGGEIAGILKKVR